MARGTLTLAARRLRQIKALEAELTEAREALADWKGKADQLEAVEQDLRLARVEIGTLKTARDRLEREADLQRGRARDATERESVYRQQRDENGARAGKAERQLAEYRVLLAALPCGIALAYPAALPLLRAYLNDRESDNAG